MGASGHRTSPDHRHAGRLRSDRASRGDPALHVHPQNPAAPRRRSLIRPARDRALLLLGLASALTALGTGGADRGRGRKLSVAALRTWLATAGITDGAAFRAVDRYGRTATSLERGGVGFVLW